MKSAPLDNEDIVLGGICSMVRPGVNGPGQPRPVKQRIRELIARGLIVWKSTSETDGEWSLSAEGKKLVKRCLAEAKRRKRKGLL